MTTLSYGPFYFLIIENSVCELNFVSKILLKSLALSGHLQTVSFTCYDPHPSCLLHRFSFAISAGVFWACTCTFSYEAAILDLVTVED